MEEIEEIIDNEGFTRRLGSLTKPSNFVSTFKTYEEEKPVWDDSDIIKVCQDPNRRVARKIFDNSWRQNQQSHGSCNGYAGAAAFSRARYYRGLRDNLLFSGAYVYSKINGGRDQGSALEDGLVTIEKNGVCLESLVNWDMIYPKKQPSNADAEAAKHKGLACYAVETLQGLKTALAAGYSCIVAIHAGSRFSRIDSNGVAGVDNGSGNHAVCLDDLLYKNGDFLYDMPNSWGLSYGDNGRAYLRKDHFSQTMKYHQFYAIPSTIEA